MSNASADSKTCSLIDKGHRCTRPSINASITKRAWKAIQAKTDQLQPDPEATHSRICRHHKDFTSTILPVRSSKKAKRPSTDADMPQVNFSLLSTTTLKRYRKHYKLEEVASKPELIQVVEKHFASQKVFEMDTIVLFTNSVKRGLARS
eukprot:m.186064 g.186064  ORF g.186064 m.186064 type:complete len:149 (-) comp14746_c0_seq2:2475-2921(-)